MSDLGITGLGFSEEAMGSYGPDVMKFIEGLQQQFLVQQTRSKINSAVTKVFHTASNRLESWGRSYMVRREAQAAQENSVSQKAPNPTIENWEESSGAVNTQGMGPSGISVIDQELEGLAQQSVDMNVEEDIFENVEADVAQQLEDIS